ncbi:unnamed protein product [Hermetia illucens]|uniref:Uncharacterized protein n=1 Tax=Hermetia illucens TaxID=343691 RepID=A0A7R8YSA4_HERIL|nr:unnamed protein product [Hermetia illucens]
MVVNEEKELNSSHGNVAEDLTVSLFGVATTVGSYSGKALDTLIKSSIGQLCSNQKAVMDENSDEFEEWFADHEEDCSINHEGSSGKLEIGHYAFQRNSRFTVV